eukprot:TRINITY_DN9431_c0_g1_i11.p5 TRINITY_DN9431_c0_g1~~TRINITY_DN9431_c0_g1_i11.p5  ORF type:complete len:109 (+),score=27.99 TRINITY_DN9431_c0_g1_i11:670-996(+)
MSFLAAFLYLTYNDEAIVFDMLCTLMSSTEVSCIFKASSFHKIIYQMNKLVAIYLPRLHTHLCQEGINASYFASSWVSTAFASILQLAKKKAVPLLVNSVLDGFLLVA